MSYKTSFEQKGYSSFSLFLINMCGSPVTSLPADIDPLCPPLYHVPPSPPLSPTPPTTRPPRDPPPPAARRRRAAAAVGVQPVLFGALQVVSAGGRGRPGVLSRVALLHGGRPVPAVPRPAHRDAADHPGPLPRALLQGEDGGGARRGGQGGDARREGRSLLRSCIVSLLTTRRQNHIGM